MSAFAIFHAPADFAKQPRMLEAKTLPELLRAAAEKSPEAEAFRYRDERLAYRDWDALASRVGDGLRGRGVGRGDVVALLLPSTPFYLIAYMGIARIGAVTAGINVRYRRSEIGHILRRAGAKLLIAVDRWHDMDFRQILDEIRGDLPDLKEIAWLTADELRASTRSAIENFSAGDGRRATDDGPAQPDDPVAIVFTSGTTGIPKGAWYTHRNLLALAEIDSRRYASGSPPSKHLAAGLSFAHVGTMTRIATQIGHLGSSLIHDTFDPAAVLELIERERLQHLGGIPTQIIMLLDHPDRPKRDLSSLRTILVGGAPSSPALIRRIQEVFKAEVNMRYSSTEVGIATASLPSDPPEILTTTVGKATPGVELRVVDDANQPVAAGVPGKVTIRSPATMRGYWRDPEATAATIDADGWIHTGDLGFLDGDGYLHLLGRESEMFIRGGYNVYPAEVEDLLAKHPKIARAAIVGRPDDVFGEIGWAFIVPRSPADPPTLEELRLYVGKELASFKRPDGLTILTDMPVTPMFKVDKRALKERR